VNPPSSSELYGRTSAEQFSDASSIVPPAQAAPSSRALITYNDKAQIFSPSTQPLAVGYLTTVPPPQGSMMPSPPQISSTAPSGGGSLDDNPLHRLSRDMTTDAGRRRLSQQGHALFQAASMPLAVHPPQQGHALLAPMPQAPMPQAPMPQASMPSTISSIGHLSHQHQQQYANHQVANALNPARAQPSRMPKGWESRTDASGRVFFANRIAKCTAWELPTETEFQIEIRESGQLGLELQKNHTVGKMGAVIKQVIPHTAAHRFGRLQAGQELTAINNVPVMNHGYEDVMRRLRAAIQARPLVLAFSNPIAVSESEAVQLQGIVHETFRFSGALGIELEQNPIHDVGAKIKHILPGCLAAESGKLRSSQQLVAINGRSLTAMTFKETMEYLKRAVQTRPIALTVHDPNQIGRAPRVVQVVFKVPGTLGIEFGQTGSNQGAIVRNIIARSEAEYSCRIERGLHLVGINGLDVGNKPFDTTISFLKEQAATRPIVLQFQRQQDMQDEKIEALISMGFDRLEIEQAMHQTHFNVTQAINLLTSYG